MSTSQQIIETENKFQLDCFGTCRICLEDYYPLFFPCRCTGSMGIHEECFISWLQHAKQYDISKIEEGNDFWEFQCELCKQKIKFTCQAEFVFTQKLKCTLAIYLMALFAQIGVIILIIILTAGADNSQAVWIGSTPIIIVFLCCFVSTVLLLVQKIKQESRHSKRLKNIHIVQI